MTRLYRFIFDKSQWWWGKMAASTLIGALIGAKAAHRATESTGSSNWPMYAFIGGLVGFVASFFLMLNDYRRQVNIDDASKTPAGAKPRWSMGMMILMVVGLIVLILVGGFVWTMISLSR